jgi:hypothetical protein
MPDDDIRRQFAELQRAINRLSSQHTRRSRYRNRQRQTQPQPPALLPEVSTGDALTRIVSGYNQRMADHIRELQKERDNGHFPDADLCTRMDRAAILLMRAIAMQHGYLSYPPNRWGVGKLIDAKGQIIEEPSIGEPA